MYKIIYLTVLDIVNYSSYSNYDQYIIFIKIKSSNGTVLINFTR